MPKSTKEAMKAKAAASLARLTPKTRKRRQRIAKGFNTACVVIPLIATIGEAEQGLLDGMQAVLNEYFAAKDEALEEA